MDKNDTSPGRDKTQNDLDDLDDDLLDEVDLDGDFAAEPGDADDPADWSPGAEPGPAPVEAPRATKSGVSRKKSSSAGLLVVLGGVVVLGTGAWFAFSGLMGGGTPTPPAPAAVAQTPAAIEPPAIEVEVAEAPRPPQPAALEPMPRPDAAPPPAPGTEVEAPKGLLLDPAGLEAALGLPAAPVEASSAEALTPMPAMAASPAKPAPIPEVETPAAPEPALPSPAPEVSALTDRLAAAEAAQVQTNEKVAAVAGQVDALAKTLERLEGKLDALADAPSTTPPPLVKPAAKSVAKPAVKAKPKSGTKSASRAAKPRPSAVKWELRSASDGQALVSKAGGADVYTVTVGASLPGIGRVTAIAPDASGRWVVQGTQGVITQ